MESFAEGRPAGKWELGAGPRQAYLSSPEKPHQDAPEQTQDHVGQCSVEELCGSGCECSYLGLGSEAWEEHDTVGPPGTLFGFG